MGPVKQKQRSISSMAFYLENVLRFCEIHALVDKINTKLTSKLVSFQKTLIVKRAI